MDHTKMLTDKYVAEMQKELDEMFDMSDPGTLDFCKKVFTESFTKILTEYKGICEAEFKRNTPEPSSEAIKNATIDKILAVLVSMRPGGAIGSVPTRVTLPLTKAKAMKVSADGEITYVDGRANNNYNAFTNFIKTQFNTVDLRLKDNKLKQKDFSKLWLTAKEKAPGGRDDKIWSQVIDEYIDARDTPQE